MPKKPKPETKPETKPKIEKPTLKKQDGRKNNGGARENAGRKEFQPTKQDRKVVESMSGFGIPIKQIAALVREGISVDTLTKHFEKELVLGKANANTKVAQTLHQKAIDGDVTAAIFWAKTQMGFKETKKHELGGEDGAPIETSTEIKISDKDFESLAKKLISET